MGDFNLFSPGLVSWGHPPLGFLNKTGNRPSAIDVLDEAGGKEIGW